MREALQDADVVMMLRIQQERQGKTLMPNAREYSRYFGLNPENLKLAKPDAMVMHPGPINRGVEMSSVWWTATSPRSSSRWRTAWR